MGRLSHEQAGASSPLCFTGHRSASVLLAIALSALSACGSASQSPHRARHVAETPSPRLFLAGDGELWVVDVAAERVRHVKLPQLAPGDPPDRIVRRGNRFVLWGYDTYVLKPN